MLTRRTTTLALSTALPLLAALTGGCAQTGGQTGEEQTSCWSRITPLPLSAESPLGFSAQDSLNLAAGQHEVALHWLPNRAYGYGPESGEGQLQVTITSLGSARFATQTQDQAITELLCLPSVLTDVTVELDSAGGAFHESFRGLLIASNEDSATLSGTLLSTHLSGGFAFDPATLGGRTLAQVTLNLSVSASSFSGTIAAGLEHVAGNGVSSSTSFENVLVACFGSAALPGQAGCTE